MSLIPVAPFDDMTANEQSRNRGNGNSEIEGKAAMGSGERTGTRASFKGISEIEGKVAEGSDERMEPRDACDIDGQTDRSNGALGKSDIEGKVGDFTRSRNDSRGPNILTVGKCPAALRDQGSV